MKYAGGIKDERQNQSPSARREWIEMKVYVDRSFEDASPSARREWIEIRWRNKG